MVQNSNKGERACNSFNGEIMSVTIILRFAMSTPGECI